MSKRKSSVLTLERVDRPHAVRLVSTEPRKRIVSEERNAGPGRVVRVHVLAEIDELDRIKDKLSERELRAAEKLRWLWETAALTGRRVTARYDVIGGMGTGEMSDDRAQRVKWLREVIQAMGLWHSADVLALVCYDEPRDVGQVAEGLRRAADRFGM